MKHKFKIGDKVKVIKKFCGIESSQLEKIAIISGMDETVINLDFEKDWNGNSAGGTSPNNNGYNMWLDNIDNNPEDYLLLISNQEPNYEIY